jgi:hypothetical protein
MAQHPMYYDYEIRDAREAAYEVGRRAGQLEGRIEGRLEILKEIAPMADPLHADGWCWFCDPNCSAGGLTTAHAPGCLWLRAKEAVS